MPFRLVTAMMLALGLVPLGYSQDASGGSAPAMQERPISLGRLIPTIWEDQKQIYWKFPSQLAQGKHWVPVAGFLAATAGLIAVDQFDARYFRRSSSYCSFNNVFSGTNTAIGIAIAPLAMYGAGWLTKDSYAQNTALLAGEAVADAEILTELLKIGTKHARPYSISPNGNFADTWWEGRSISQGGFPSGHAAAAFSVATIFSQRYEHQHRWVPYAAYGLATTIGFSRMTTSAHSPADVFVGATLGYIISRFVVLRSPRHPAD